MRDPASSSTGSRGPERRRGPGTGAARLPRLLAAVLTGTMAAGLAFLSLLPLPGEEPTEGVLLLDWRLRGEETGSCLRAPAAELERLPVHMRGQDACLGALPPYRLRVTVDGTVVLDEEVRGGGLRGDRPLTVYRELALAPGRREVEARFVREDGDPEAVALVLRDTVEARAGRVLLLVRRQDTGVLEIREPAG